jgi:hypothetical protein
MPGLRPAPVPATWALSPISEEGLRHSIWPGFGSCPAFDSSSDISIQLQATYEATMPALYFGADSLPDWVAICRRVAERRDLL